MSARGRGRRQLAWALAVVLGAAAAIALAPALLAPYAARRLSAAAGVPVRVGWVTWNPLAGRVVLHDVALALAPDTPAVATARALAAEVALRSLLGGGDLVVTRLAIDRPWVALRRTASGDFNVATLLRAAAPGPAPTPAGTGARPAELATPPGAAAPRAPTAAVPGAAPGRTVVVAALRIRGGSIEFRDETTTPALETSLHLEDVGAEDLAVARSGRTNVDLHLRSRLERTPLVIHVAYRASGADSRLRVDLGASGVALERTLVYVPLGWRRVSGTLDLSLSYAREVTHGRLRAHALGARATAHDVALAEPWAETPTVRAAHARLERIGVDFLRRRTDVAAVAVDGFTAVVARGVEGVHAPFAGGGSSAPGAWTTAVHDVKLGGGEIVLRNVVPGADPELRATVRSGRMRSDDAGVTMRLATTTSAGAIDVEGRFAEDATLRLTLHALALPELAARLRLPVGFATGAASGTLEIAGLADAAPRLSGTLHLAGGRTLPVDPQVPHETLAWQDLVVEIAEASLAPARLRLARLSAEWPYAMIHRAAGGIFPATLLRRRDGPAADAAASSAAVAIDELALHHGRIEFWDTTLTPPYWTELTDVDLAGEGLVLAPSLAGTLTLGGAVEELSPLRASAALGGERRQARVTVDRLHLVPLNAYLEPVLHYAITSGVARIAAEATLAGTRLEASNDVVLSRFGLTRTGEDALQGELGAPLSVALALMKDYRGDISLRLPLEGDLGTQEFALPNVLSTALKRSLLGALRAPVTLLGAALHRPEEERFDLHPVPFPAGSAELAAEGAARVAEIARLLARHDQLDVVLLPEPSPADAAALGGGAPPPERLATLAAARAAAVGARLVDEHRVARERISDVPWTSGALDPETQPGVDVQLRGR